MKKDNKMFYVYEMIDPRNNQVFYIGKGTYRKGTSMRWVKHIREAELWYPGKKVTNTQKTKIIKEILEQKLLPINKVVFETNIEEYTLIKERELITLYGRLVNNTGYLTNLIEGGSGFSNYTEQMKQIRQIQNSGSNNPMFGKRHSEESKQKIGITRKQNIKSKNIIPINHTQEHRDKMKGSNPGGDATAKSIYQIDALTGEVIKEWKAMRQAGIELNIVSWRNISIINKNKVQTIGGFYWRWVGDLDVVNNQLINIKELNDIRLNPSKRSGKQVQQITEDGELIKVWNTMGEIEKHFGLYSGAISGAIKANKLYIGFYWKKC